MDANDSESAGDRLAGQPGEFVVYPPSRYGSLFERGTQRRIRAATEADYEAARQGDLTLPDGRVVYVFPPPGMFESRGV